VINETLAHIFFPGTSPIGHRMQFGNRDNPFHTIVGVVRDVRERGYLGSLKPGVYLSIAQAPEAWAVPEFLVIRARGRAAVLAESARRVIAGVDPAQPVSSVRTMEQIMDVEVTDRRQQMTLLSGFAALALTLASLGLYGLLAYAVTQRNREIGLRIALGASATNVVGMIALRGVLLAAIGLTLGVVAGWMTTRAMSNVLYGVQPNDAATFLSGAALLGAVALIASLIPAMRAARVDPMVVLREP
jgi:predicted lysophospholipase L1 biosynthesis ABC-type transport system permease subunit